MSASRWNRKFRLKIDEVGVTLVELMVVVAISGIIVTAVAAVYQAQSTTYAIHDEVSNMQNDLRGALAVLPMEVRLAGCDPTESGVPRILVATRNSLRFTRDIRSDTDNNADGDVDDAEEDIAYGFAGTGDVNNNGIVDNNGADWSGIAPLGRAIGGGVLEPLADNIEALEFNYILADGTSTNGSGVASATQPNVPITNVNDIRAVQVSLLARTATSPAGGEVGSTQTNTYTTASGIVWNPTDDRFRRRLVVFNIQCRNMGM
jgi:type IV pilus assembly protein PilW